MSTDREAIAAQLERSRLWDGAGLDPAGRARLEALVADTPGLRVVLLPADAEPRPYRALWDRLGLDPRTDLLLLVGDGRWEARGFGLDQQAISRALDEAEPALAEGTASGVLAAVRGLEDAATGGSASSVALGLGGLGALAALSGLGWILWRRSRLRGSEAAREWDEARAEVEDAVAHLVLSAEALGGSGLALQQRAARLREEIGRIPRDDAPNVRVARLRRLGDEAVALQSQVSAARSRTIGGEG